MAPTDGGGYGRGAGILSVGIGATGLITYGYFSLASHTLSESDYGGITLLWSAVFITVSVLYRPVEQLLSRTIADRDTRGTEGREHLRVAATIQLALGALFAVAALALRGPLQDDLFGGSETLYWVLIVTVLAYAVSYFARGFLAGSRRYEAYGGLVLMEALSRVMFAVAVAVGIAEGQSVVALGMAAAPIVSLAVVPFALGRSLRQGGPAPEENGRAQPVAGEAEFTLSHGAGFAVSVLAIMLAEQTFLNAGPLLVKATEGEGGAALAGFTFNVLLIARAPLQLFQAVQTSILPHLTRLGARGETDPFRRTVNVTLIAIAGFAAAVALVMLVAGPTVMDLVFGGDFEYDRLGLVLISFGMGLYLCAATLNQALLARGQARQACTAWLVAAAGFVDYGFPVHGEVATKAAQDLGGPSVDVQPSSWQPDAEQVARVTRFLDRILPGYSGPELYTRCCLYDMPPDRDFVVDVVPGHPRVAVAVGAGHAAKFASLFGRILAELTVDGETAFRIDAFRADRPALTDPAFEPAYRLGGAVAT